MKAVMIFGPPGSGKGTQANLLAWKRGFVHFDSGKYLRNVLHDPARQKEKLVQRERKLNDAGMLNTPSWVLSIFKAESKKIHDAGMSIVYSGSPRTMYEAFGDSKTEGLVAFLQKLYGKKNLHFISLEIPPSSAIKRNKKRRVCTICSTGVLATSKAKECPICAGPLKMRIDDRAEVAKARINEFKTRTEPIFKELKKRGEKLVKIDGTPAPYKVYEKISKKIPK